MSDSLDLNGLATVAKLIESRVENDIAATEAQLRAEEARELSTAQNLLANARNCLIENARARLQKEIADKRRWCDTWRRTVWLGLAGAGADVNDLQRKSLADCLAAYPTGTPLEFQRFLICQDAILAPVYAEFEDLPKGLQERDRKGQYQFVAAQAGFSASIGSDIHQNTEAFFSSVSGYWGKLVRTALIGSVTLASVLLVSAVPIAAFIGGLAGLHGAAAISFGLAFLGGGSLAAGGMGMAGGVMVVGVGGTAIGAGAGAGVAKYLAEMPTEAAALDMAKLVNYLRHLQTVTGASADNARRAKAEAISRFLEAKHLLEKQVMEGDLSKQTITKAVDIIHILNFTFDRLTV